MVNLWLMFWLVGVLLTHWWDLLLRICISPGGSVSQQQPLSLLSWVFRQQTGKDPQSLSMNWWVNLPHMAPTWEEPWKSTSQSGGMRLACSSKRTATHSQRCLSTINKQPCQTLISSSTAHSTEENQHSIISLIREKQIMGCIL